MTTSIRLTVLILLTLGLLFPLRGQEQMTAAEQQAVIDSLGRLLETNYVFPNVGRAMADDLRERLNAGQYRSTVEVSAFGDQLTADLQAISHDKHLRVNFNPAMAQDMRRLDDEGDDGGPSDEWLQQLRRDNFGFQSMKILDGNVGYLDLRGFMPPAMAGETAAAAMNFLANADAIIFDLRQNGGGSPAMIQLLTSYLYGERESRHLNSFYYRPSDDTTQTWTLPFVPGRRNAKAKVYVLTSGYTFSAAEEFTYNLKNLKRGTIVGETTGGGAHPGGMMPVADRFVAFIPTGRAINPITGTNWEGAGVTPQVAVPADQALDKAYLMALDSLAKGAPDERNRQYYTWYAQALRARLQPVSVPAKQLQAYAGEFGQRSLLFENGKLYYQRSGRPKMELQALTIDTFAPKDRSDFRIQVEVNNGKTTALLIRYDDGRSDRYERSSAQP